MKTLLRLRLCYLLILALVACDNGSGESQTDGGVLSDGAVQPDVIQPDLAPVPDTVSPFPEDPFEGLNKTQENPALYFGNSSFGDGKASLLLWAPSGYNRYESWPLMVYLHGGGQGMTEQDSQLLARDRLVMLVPQANADRFIWLAGILRVAGSNHAWVKKENALDVVDAIREVAKRFNVDHQRVFITGTSMGAGGLASLSWIIPHAFAAYGPVAGYYFNQWCSPPDLTGVQYRVVHGAKDKWPEEPYNRLGLAEEFVRLSTEAGATVEKVILPGVGHEYPTSEMGKMNAYFLEHQLEAPTDWTGVRGQVEAFYAP